MKGKLSNDRDNAYLSRKLAEILVDIPLPEEPRLPLATVNAAAQQQPGGPELNSLLRQVNGFTTTFSAAGTATAASSDERGEGNGSSVKTNAADDAGADDRTPMLRPQLISTAAELTALMQRLMAITDADTPGCSRHRDHGPEPVPGRTGGHRCLLGGRAGCPRLHPDRHRPADASSPRNSSAVAAGESVLTALAPWLASGNHPKALQNAKYDRLIPLRHGLALAVVISTLLADYLRDAAAKHGLEVMAEREFGFSPTAYSDLVGKKQTFADVAIEPASLYCGMDVHVTRRLALRLREQLDAMGPQMVQPLLQVEQPLEPVLALMEATGIRIDVPLPGGTLPRDGSTLERLEAGAKEAAGTDFNLGSPKQLGELLFGTLGLDRKKSRRTKTGFSTDATVLEKLENDHPVVPLVLEHRVLSKLKSTYVDALPQLVEGRPDGCTPISTRAVTATGRLSSSNPNLQNIPVRTDYSRRIRKAFLPQEDGR